MNWLLVIIINSTPVKTDLVFGDFQSCRYKEFEIANIYTDKINEDIKWVKSQNLSEEEQKSHISYYMTQGNRGVCIPTMSEITVK